MLRLLERHGTVFRPWSLLTDMQHFWSRASFVWSEQVVIGPCSHPCCPLLCRRTHWAETKQREKLRISSCLSGSSNGLPVWACVGRRSHRTRSVLDGLPLPGFGCLRWSRPVEMAISPNTLNRPCHPGGDQACQSGEASQMEPHGRRALRRCVTGTYHGTDRFD